MREIQKWLVRPLSIGIASSDELPSTDVVIINYDILHRHHDGLRRRHWDMLIADESHYLKNPKARRTQQVLGRWDRDPEKRIARIDADRCLWLTGTPILNRPVELWPLLKRTGWRGSWKDYVER